MRATHAIFDRGRCTAIVAERRLMTAWARALAAPSPLSACTACAASSTAAGRARGALPGRARPRGHTAGRGPPHHDVVQRVLGQIALSATTIAMGSPTWRSLSLASGTWVHGLKTRPAIEGAARAATGAPKVAQVRRGVYRHDSRPAASGGGVDAREAGVGVLAAEKRDVQQPSSRTSSTNSARPVRSRASSFATHRSPIPLRARSGATGESHGRDDVLVAGGSDTDSGERLADRTLVRIPGGRAGMGRAS